MAAPSMYSSPGEQRRREEEVSGLDAHDRPEGEDDDAEEDLDHDAPADRRAVEVHRAAFVPRALETHVGTTANVSFNRSK